MFHKINNPVHAARVNFENRYLQREYAGQSETRFIKWNQIRYVHMWCWV